VNRADLAPDAGARGRTASPDETERLAERLAASLRAGDVVVLRGPLGAGKTRFAAGIARGLGAAGRVKSPTFTLVHEHPGPVPLFHADLYRLEPADAERLGLEEMAERGVLVVEWGERLPPALRAEAIEVAIAIDSETARTLEASAAPGRGRALVEAFRAAAGDAR